MPAGHVVRTSAVPLLSEETLQNQALRSVGSDRISVPTRSDQQDRLPESAQGERIL